MQIFYIQYKCVVVCVHTLVYFYVTFHREESLVFLLDGISRIAFRVPQWQKYIHKTYKEMYESLEPLQAKKSGFLASLPVLGRNYAPFTLSAQIVSLYTTIVE